MKVSVCITTFNEEQSIEKLLKSILSQTKVPDEIVIVDGGSTDKTVERIRNYKKVRLIISKGTSIAKGRNLAVKKAIYSMIAMTEPFLGIMPSKFDAEKFLPSTRSIAFKKSVWEKIGGFNEKFDRAGEDTEFNLQLSKFNFQIERKKSAIVYWEVPDNLVGAMKKFLYYARGDAQIGEFTKHNIKVITIFLRYILFLFIRPLFFVYLFWAIYKHRKFTKNWRQRIYTVIIQLASDFSVMLGFLNGIF